MKLILNVALACFSSLLWFWCISCDELPQGPSAGKWTCVCASSDFGKDSHAFVTNCSTACDCRPDDIGGSNGTKWTCFCSSEEAPAALGNIHSASCFTACNCTSGSQDTSSTPRKRISSKAVVYILLLCVAFTTIAFLASFACCIYRKDKCHVQPPIFSTDKDTSWNSAANLISHKSVSMTDFQVKMKSHFNPITGCMHKASFMFRSKRGMIPGAIIQFSYYELEQATNKFSNSRLVGLGGSSNVYRGELRDGRVIAVKRLKSQGGPNADFDFLTEIELISRLNHCHVVPLLGYCSESQGRHVERLLVFEYMSNGNLRDCLDVTQGKEPIDWGTRVGIALGAARGLEYLHEAAAPRILHRDVKSTNILLDEKWRAKITDLGLAKRLMADDLPSCSNSPARMLGTFGYFAPECAIIGRASLKSDVFSFGVVLLELISGRQPINRSCKRGEESLVIWATPLLHDSRRLVLELVDPLLKGDFPEEEMQIMGHLARECLQLDPDSRPSMSEVAQILSTITPDKSRRINFPVNLFQSSMSRSMRSVVETVERPEERTINVVCSGELKQAASEKQPIPCSLPLANDRDFCDGNGSKEADDTLLSMDFIERLVLLTSQAQNSPEEETVDLTEPRFESFLEANAPQSI